MQAARHFCLRPFGASFDFGRSPLFGGVFDFSSLVEPLGLAQDINTCCWQPAGHLSSLRARTESMARLNVMPAHVWSDVPPCSAAAFYYFVPIQCTRLHALCLFSKEKQSSQVLCGCGFGPATAVVYRPASPIRVAHSACSRFSVPHVSQSLKSPPELVRPVARGSPPPSSRARFCRFVPFLPFHDI